MKHGRRQSSRDLLGAAEQQFDRWRSKGSPGRVIPEALWKVAARAAESQGISKTARVLRLNHTALKEHLAKESGGRRGMLDPVSTEFLQVPPMLMPSGPECLVEVEDGSGARLRIELTGRATSELECALRTLWTPRG